MSEMVPMGSYFGLNNGTSGVMYSGNSSIINSNPVISQAGNASGSSLLLDSVPGNSSIINSNPVISQAGDASGSSLLLDSVPGLKQEAGWAVEWSVDDRYKLEEGLVKYADEPSIMKYVKIAATLQDKTVRDVALRCRWMTRKRRKPEEHNLIKKVNFGKDKPVESSSSKQYLQSALPPSMATYAYLSPHLNESQWIIYDGVCGPVKQLLEQNAQAISQINANLSTYKLQDNIDLFSHARQNICTILNNMSEMPGIMSQMPPLPVSLNEELARSILPTKLSYSICQCN